MFSAGVACAILSTCIGLAAFYRSRRRWMLAGPAASFVLMASIAIFPPEMKAFGRANTGGEVGRARNATSETNAENAGWEPAPPQDPALEVSRLLMRTLERTAPEAMSGWRDDEGTEERRFN